MSFLVWQQATPPLHRGSDAELDAARDTDVAVVPDEPEAMEDAPPEFGAPAEVDPRVRLGLATRSTASFVVPTEKYAWGIPTEQGQVAGDAIPDAGTASAREKAGDFGHGSMMYAVGIDPSIGAAPSFGFEYFVVHDRDINENATASEWGIQPGFVSVGTTAEVSQFSADAMIRARHAAETGEGYDLGGLWD